MSHLIESSRGSDCKGSTEGSMKVVALPVDEADDDECDLSLGLMFGCDRPTLLLDRSNNRGDGIRGKCFLVLAGGRTDPSDPRRGRHKSSTGGGGGGGGGNVQADCAK